MNILAFAASHRKQSINRRLAAMAVEFAKRQGAEVDFPEYGAFDMPIYDDELFDPDALPASAMDFIARLNNADGVIISCPEYNWSFPGSLKNIIDWASVVTPCPFAGKTALLISASPSLRGGAQGLIQLRVPLEALGMFVLPRIFTLGRAAEAFNEARSFKDAKLSEELGLRVAEFIRVTGALKTSYPIE